MQSSLVSRNVKLSGGRTSMRLEAEFWTTLKTICAREQTSLGAWIDRVSVDALGGRTSAVRVSVLRYLRDADASIAAVAEPPQWRAELGGMVAARSTVSDGSAATMG